MLPKFTFTIGSFIASRKCGSTHLPLSFKLSEGSVDIMLRTFFFEKFSLKETQTKDDKSIAQTFSDDSVM